MEPPSPTKDPTAILTAADAAGAHTPEPNTPEQPTTPELQAPLTQTAGDRCRVCSAPLTPDQRYCVECGQRLPPARPLLMGQSLEPASAIAGAPPRQRFGLTPNSTLIAGIFTLLLAMAVGILIGRSGQSNSNPKRSATTPIITLPSTTGTTASGTSASATNPSSSSTPATATKGAKSTTSPATGEGSKAPPSKPGQAASHPATPPVKVGQKGSGKGYQHGKFTGHFFGGESEEEASEAAGSSSKSGKSVKAGKK